MLLGFTALHVRAIRELVDDLVVEYASAGEEQAQMVRAGGALRRAAREQRVDVSDEFARLSELIRPCT